ncbi:MAG: substrate-binding domain-containing protein [Butyrivibrio sp.]|nr:substrate-binding domain-containing protein [Butyrivibrio sp.]
MKNNNKRLISYILLTALLALTLMGCGNASSGSSSAKAAGNAKVLYIVTDRNDTFRELLSSSIENAAANQKVALDVVETGDDVAAQVAEVSKAKAAGYGAIILRSADPGTALQMNVASNDIPIVYVNNEPSSSHLEDSKYVYVGSDEMQSGQYQAEYVLKRLGNPKSLDVIIFEGEAGHSATIGRTKAVKRTLKENGCNANYVFVDYADWSDAEAKTKLGIFMKTGQNVDAIFCNNDSMALGVIEGMKQYGLDYNTIPVCGVDATADGCASIMAGEMAFTVLQDAKNQAAAAVSAAAVMAGGGSITGIEGATSDGKYIYVPFVPVDSTNVSQYSG